MDSLIMTRTFRYPDAAGLCGAGEGKDNPCGIKVAVHRRQNRLRRIS